MRTRLFSAFVLGFGLVAAWTQFVYSQDANPTPQTQGVERGQGQRGGRGGGNWGFMMGAGRGTMGTVTEAAADHYTIKTETGDIYTVHFSVNTRIMKQQPGTRGPGGSGGQRAQTAQGGGEGEGRAANPPQQIKPTDIKVGDVIAANGEVDAAAKSVGAVFIAQIDPERAKQMREMEANYGKTWLMGKVTAVDGVKVTLAGSIDKTPHTFVADENTTFRKRRDPITLADVQVGDTVRVEGAMKDGAFVATSVGDMGVPQPEETPMAPRGNPPQ